VVSGFSGKHRLIDLESGAVSELALEGEHEAEDSPWSFAFTPEDGLIALDPAGRRLLHLAIVR
jgi:hypothetical protein